MGYIAEYIILLLLQLVYLRLRFHMMQLSHFVSKKRAKIQLKLIKEEKSVHIILY